MNSFILLSLAILSEVIGTTALRASEGFTKPLPSIIVVLGYGAAFYLVSLTLKQIPLGTTYAIWSGVGTALTAIIGVVLWRERLEFWSICGIGLIIAGVVLLNLFSKGHAA
jgi:small multidrug resistance pump